MKSPCVIKTISIACILALATLAGATTCPAEEASLSRSQRVSPFSLRVCPEVSVPLGADATLFPYGAGATLSALYRPPSLPLFLTGLETGYSYFSTNAPDTNLSTATLGGLAGLHFQLTRSLSARLLADAGGFIVALNDSGISPQFNLYAGGGFTLGWDLSRSLSLSAGAGYRCYFGLLGGITAGLGLSYQLPSRAPTRQLPPGFVPVRTEARGLKIVGIKLDSLFPVFYKHYDDHPVGEAVLYNFEGTPAEDVKVFLEVKRYMDNPKECQVPLSVKAGEDGRIVLYGLFTDKILEVAEATKLSVSICVEYKQYGKTFKNDYIQTLSVLDRNALTWSDDRKAAAFISARDPQALAFSKSVMVAVNDVLKSGVNANIQTAIALHQALLQDRIAYVDDPTSALTTNNREIVDFIQYPQQTLDFRAGKCGDLTVLYCSLFEAVGVATALITVPGHILMAFDLEMTEEEAKRTFSNPDDLIYMNGHVWLPIETTLRSGNFLDSWTEGIRQWRVGVQQETVAFYPVREAWQSYNPVVFSGQTETIAMPDSESVARSFTDTLAVFIDRQLGVRVAELQRQIKNSGGNPQLVNRLGLLYARFGQYTKAEEQFRAILDKQEIHCALYNLGNIYYLRGDYTEALSYYNRALKKAPNDPRSVLAIVKTNVALDKYSAAKEGYDKLKSLDPELASSIAFLGSGSEQGIRAADARKVKGEVIWQD
jgi:tetratricopeptide (TPR) repeat protein